MNIYPGIEFYVGDERKYRIFLKAVPEKNIDEGWWGGSNSRCNSVIYDRTDDKRDANVLDEYNAVQFWADFKRYGWPCEIYPDIPNDRRLELLIR